MDKIDIIANSQTYIGLEDIAASAEENPETKAMHQKFLSRISHEIRTPLNTVIGLTELAKGRVDDPEYMASCIDRIEVSAQYLLNLINGLLDVSEKDQDSSILQEKNVNFAEFIKKIVDATRNATNEKRVNFRSSIKEGVAEVYRFDSWRLKQVLDNLLSNSVKFTPRYGTIDFIVQKVSSENNIDKLEFIVRDTGIGIAPEFLPKIFDMFEQEYTGDTVVYSGVGLGLAITRNIVRLLGGQVFIKSKKGIGTEIKIVLDMKIAEEAQINQPGISEAEYNFLARRVLLVEDNEINAQITKEMLLRRNMDVEVAENGREALSMYMMNPPNYFDLILMDIRMPYMDGLTATRKIRTSGKSDCKGIPILALTANAMEEDEVRSKDAGMNAHITKPVKPKTLYKAIERAMQGEWDFN